MRMSAEVMIRLLHLSYRQAPCSTTRQAAVTSSLSPRANQIQRGGTELKSRGRLCACD
ncbi:hypothetical protein ALC56_12324 [Trachymyrmex septentrionalis]|uniref:Uncharacterized protein n=1 Tax=Trachymyrmex septentrionalis TaxID=34720 RepID=A0A195F0C7_9HYME|nr:hypothetical protein ALC56_12324 [Trachymyrmex septentrionalis]